MLIGNLPPKTLVGIDLLSFTSSPNFHGIKDLPAGAHFLYTGTSDSFSLRSGEWIFIQSSASTSSQSGVGLDIRLRKWDEGLETLVQLDESTDEGKQEAMQRRANLGPIWRAGGLLAYRSQWDGKDIDREGMAETVSPARGDWNCLTNYISPAVLDRVLGPRKTAFEQDARWTITSGSSAACDKDQIPGLTATEAAAASGVAGEQEKNLQFLPIDLKRTWREGAIGRERTEAARDRSWALGDLIDRFAGEIQAENDTEATPLEPGEMQCLGEMQLTFLMVLTLMNFSCLEQWKRLLGIFLTCHAAIKARENFFIKMLQLLRVQLSHCNDVEGGLFEMDGDDGGSLLKSLLSRFRTSVDEVLGEQPSPVKTCLEHLEQWARKEFGWELQKGNIVRRGLLELEDGELIELDMNGAEEEDESGEYAPVIVNADDSAELYDVDMEGLPHG